MTSQLQKLKDDGKHNFLKNISTSKTDDKCSEIISIFQRLRRFICSFRFIIFILNMYCGMCIYTFILVEPDGETKERSTNMPEKNGEENIRTLT